MLRHGIGTLASMTVAGNRSLPSRTSSSSIRRA
jgi:hypothetical protein